MNMTKIRKALRKRLTPAEIKRLQLKINKLQAEEIQIKFGPTYVCVRKIK